MQIQTLRQRSEQTTIMTTPTTNIATITIQIGRRDPDASDGRDGPAAASRLKSKIQTARPRLKMPASRPKSKNQMSRLTKPKSKMPAIARVGPISKMLARTRVGLTKSPARTIEPEILGIHLHRNVRKKHKHSNSPLTLWVTARNVKRAQLTTPKAIKGTKQDSPGTENY